MNEIVCETNRLYSTHSSHRFGYYQLSLIANTPYLLSRMSGLSVSGQTSVSLLSGDSGQTGGSDGTHQTRLARQTRHTLLTVACRWSSLSLEISWVDNTC